MSYVIDGLSSGIYTSSYILVFEMCVTVTDFTVLTQQTMRDN